MSEEMIRCDFCYENKDVNGSSNYYWGVFGDEQCCEQCYNKLSEENSLSLMYLLESFGYAESTSRKKATEYIRKGGYTVYNKERFKIGPYEIIDCLQKYLLPSKRLKKSIREKAEKTLAQLNEDFYDNAVKSNFILKKVKQTGNSGLNQYKVK